MREAMGRRGVAGLEGRGHRVRDGTFGSRGGRVRKSGWVRRGGIGREVEDEGADRGEKPQRREEVLGGGRWGKGWQNKGKRMRVKEGVMRRGKGEMGSGMG